MGTTLIHQQKTTETLLEEKVAAMESTTLRAGNANSKKDTKYIKIQLSIN